MNTNSNTYTILYASIMVVVVAFLLAFTASVLKERQDTNVQLDKKKQILIALNVNTEDQDVAVLYAKHVKSEIVVNSIGSIISDNGGFDVDVKVENSKPLDKRNLAVYVCEVNGSSKYVLPVRGKGLWGALWGYVALNEDKNTIFGTYFTHEGETPGLGAEIANAEFQHQFIGKHILNSAAKFVSVAIKKPGQIAVGQDQVDGISGGTITSNGVSDMLKDGLEQYEKYLSIK